MKKKKRVGLVLGSGSARGWSHIGVIKCLREEHIPIDLICGCSMGAVVGGAYAAGILEALEDLAREFSWLDFLKFMDVSLSRRGLLEGNHITDFFRDQIADITIEKLPLPFGAVAVDLETGKEISFLKGPLIEAMRASFSFPGLFTPFQKDQQWLIDGGLLNPVPVSLCRSMGADVVIAVNLNDGIVGKTLIKKNNRAGNAFLQEKLMEALNSEFITSTFPFIKKKGGAELPRTKAPNMFEVMANSIYIMQDSITRQRLLEDPPDILISPRLADVALLEFNKANKTIQEGFLSAKALLPAIKNKIA
ncbi:MAG: patatin-like phospholipase family protein [Syntrophaceae bacterium]|nr:patatin-like phospholipase family protein [Syntrophaceae bacterium]